jgi:hypothetical protein
MTTKRLAEIEVLQRFIASVPLFAAGMCLQDVRLMQRVRDGADTLIKAVPELVAEVRRLNAANADLRQQVEHLRHLGECEGGPPVPR